MNWDLDMIDIGQHGVEVLEPYRTKVRRIKKACDRTRTVGRQGFREVREWLGNLGVKGIKKEDEDEKKLEEVKGWGWERLREVQIEVKDLAWFPESWRADGAFVEGWRVEVVTDVSGSGYTLLMERMDSDGKGGDDGGGGGGDASAMGG